MENIVGTEESVGYQSLLFIRLCFPMAVKIGGGGGGVYGNESDGTNQICLQFDPYSVNIWHLLSL